MYLEINTIDGGLLRFFKISPDGMQFLAITDQGNSLSVILTNDELKQVYDELKKRFENEL